MIFEDKKPVTKRIFIDDFSNFIREDGDIIIFEDTNVVIINYKNMTTKEYCKGDLDVKNFIGVNKNFYFNEQLEKLAKFYRNKNYLKYKFFEIKSGLGGTFTVTIDKINNENVVVKVVNNNDFYGQKYTIKKENLIDVKHQKGLVF